MKVVILGPSRKITFKYQRTAILKPPQEKKNQEHCLHM